jgi:hypothetical protein
VQWPAVSLLGLTTPDEFYGAMHGEVLRNGFVGRLLVLHTTECPPTESPNYGEHGIPSTLAHELKRLYQWAGPESLLQISNTNAKLTPTVIGWGTGAKELFQDFEAKVKAYRDDHSQARDFMPRTAELALRAATVRTIAGRARSVGVADLQWGIDLAWASGVTLMTHGISVVGENERSRMFKKIRDFIRNHNGPTKRREIQQMIGGVIKSSDLDGILHQLSEAGYIVSEGKGAWRHRLWKWLAQWLCRGCVS